MDRYFFDKRIIKKTLIRYGLLFLIMFPLLLVVNSGFGSKIGNGVVVVVDIVLLSIAVFLMEYFVKKIQLKRLKSTEEEVVVSGGKKNSVKSNNSKPQQTKIIVVKKPKK